MPADSTLPAYVLDSVSSLPPLPASVQRLLELVHSDEADFKEISSVIQMDQTLTARTLRAANSALYGVSRKISTVRQASVMLGSEAVVNMALSVSVMNLQNSLKKKWPLSPEAFWQHNMAVAITARQLATELGDANADQAFVAGLLHDIGKLIMMQHFGVAYGQVVLAAQDGTDPLHKLEQEIFEIDHAAVGHALCSHWNLPTPIARAVADHHAEDVHAPVSLPDIVRDANDLVKMIGLGNSGNPYAELRSRPYLSQDRMDQEALHDLILALPDEVRRAQEAFGDGSDDAPQITTTNRDDARPVIVQLDRLEERKLIDISLLVSGFESVSNSSRKSNEAVGFITDTRLVEAQAGECQERGIPILDFASWRSSNDWSMRGFFHIPRLHQWLREQLAPTVGA